MSCAYAVQVEEKLYIGGGWTRSVDDGLSVFQYEAGQDKWLKLKQYRWRRFAMAALQKKLTLVGGLDTSTQTLKATNQIAVWEEKGMSHQWTHPYPPMPTHRYSPAVATLNQWLVVAGGYDDGHNELAAVELLNIDSQQWMSMTPLPMKCDSVTSAIVQHELFLVGGTLTTTLAMSLPDSSSCTTTKTWRTLTAPPLKRTAAITFHGALLAFGGRHGKYRSKAIHIYQPTTNDWSKVEDLPTARSSCSCTLLASGEILVAGGRESDGYSSRVDVATVCS